MPGGTRLALRFLDECAAVSTASGHPPRRAFLARARGLMTARGSGFTSSMYRDLLAGSPMEVDPILGDLLGRARDHGLDAPLLEAATVQLRLHQGRLTPGAGPDRSGPAG